MADNLEVTRSQNKLETPPPEIVAEGTEAIVQYMRTLMEAETYARKTTLNAKPSKPETQNAKRQNSKPETRNAKRQPQIAKPKSRNPNRETRIAKPRSRNPSRESRYKRLDLRQMGLAFFPREICSLQVSEITCFVPGRFGI